MKALITGHRGFIGRHMQAALADWGYDVTGVDIAAPTVARGRGYLHRQDARDFFREDGTHYDLVIHCAAVVGGRQTIEGAPLKVAVDLSIDAEMFGWALRTRPGRIVYFSSSAAYPVGLQGSHTVAYWTERDGTQRPIAVPNDHRLTEGEIELGGDPVFRPYLGLPDLTYGLSKLVGEMLTGHADAAGLKVHVFRPFSGYGEDQALDYPFPTFIDRARRREDPFTIWGDGQQVRDFIHVDDVVGAVLSAVEQDVRGPVNLCTGRPTSFNELAKLVCAEAGYSPAFRHLEAMPSGVQYRVGDPTKMLEFYRPTVTLEHGVARALASKAAAA